MSSSTKCSNGYTHYGERHWCFHASVCVCIVYTYVHTSVRTYTSHALYIFMCVRVHTHERTRTHACMFILYIAREHCTHTFRSVAPPPTPSVPPAHPQRAPYPPPACHLTTPTVPPAQALLSLIFTTVPQISLQCVPAPQQLGALQYHHCNIHVSGGVWG